MTNAALKEIMDELKQDVKQGFASVNKEMTDMKQRITALETTVKNQKSFAVWVVGIVISLAGIIIAIIKS